MNLNVGQVISIFLVVLGVFVASTAQLTDIVGGGTAHLIVSISSLLMSILAGLQGVISGQASQIKAVQAMPGVDRIVVNARANSTLASLAVDPQQDKIEAAPGADRALQATASS